MLSLPSIQTCPYVYVYSHKNSNKKCFFNCSVFLTLTLIKPICITYITIWSWKRNILRNIVRNNGMNIGKIIWKYIFWFWVAWFDMYIALASISIDMHSPFPNWDTVLLKLSIAFKKLSFDCFNESLNSRLKEASSLHQIFHFDHLVDHHFPWILHYRNLNHHNLHY